MHEAEGVVILVADGGEEVRTPACLLVACSPVWQERLEICPALVDNCTPRSVETGCSLQEIEAFVGVISLTSHTPTMPSLLNTSGSSAACLRRLTAALTLVHKVCICGRLRSRILHSALMPSRCACTLAQYDAAGAKAQIIYLAKTHFPPCTIGQGNSFQSMSPLSRWITQEHINHIIRVQELFDDADLLNETCLAILAHALTIGLQWCMRRMMHFPSHLQSNIAPLFTMPCRDECALHRWAVSPTDHVVARHNNLCVRPLHVQDVKHTL